MTTSTQPLYTITKLMKGGVVSGFKVYRRGVEIARLASKSEAEDLVWRDFHATVPETEELEIFYGVIDGKFNGYK